MRNFAEINLYNIKENFRRLAGGNPAVAVVKADAYGHGAAHVARALDGDALAFAVSNIDEAEEIALIAKKTPALILGDGCPPEFDRAIDAHAVVSLGNVRNAILYDEAARRKNIRARAVICVDTGMHRDGFLYDDISGIAAALEMKNVDVVGIYTHPSRGDDEEFTAFQSRKFSAIKKCLSGRRDLIYSFASSAAIGFDNDVPRIGISLYGLSPFGTENDENLLPALAFRAAILSARRVKKGEYVGYGDAFRAERDMTVATVAAGYADGVPRAYARKGYVIVGGRRAKITGNICMDAFMACVDGIDDVKGEYATIIGDFGGESITAEEVARGCGTINYEIVCGISKRVPRIYMGSDEDEQNQI